VKFTTHIGQQEPKRRGDFAESVSKPCTVRHDFAVLVTHAAFKATVATSRLLLLLLLLLLLISGSRGQLLCNTLQFMCAGC
jgi:hypothetical protein